MTADPSPFPRIVRYMACLAAAGFIAFLVLKGLRGGVSFLAGALVSALSFWSLHHLGGIFSKPEPSAPSLAFLFFRLLVIAGVAYVILRLYEVFLPATIAGLCLSVAAITGEALREFFYARA